MADPHDRAHPHLHPSDPTRDSAHALDRFRLTANSPALFNAVVAGVELGVFAHLSRRPGARFADLRASTGVPRHQLRVLLFALCSTGLVRRESPGFVNSAVADDLLAGHDEDSWRHVLVGWRRIYYPAFARTPTGLGADAVPALAGDPGAGPALDQGLAHSPEFEAVLNAAMTAFTIRSLDGLADHLDLAAVSHLLDVGGGDGATARRLAQRHPRIRFTVFDAPGAARPGARARRGQHGRRVVFRSGDLLADAFPEGADCVLFSHCLEAFDAERAALLLAKAFDALPAGGTVHVYGFDVEEPANAANTAHAANTENPEGAEAAEGAAQEGVDGTRLSLHPPALAPGGRTSCRAGEYEKQLRAAGFDEVASVTGLPYAHALISGVKPA